MAACSVCGKKIGLFSESIGGVCEECSLRISHGQSGTRVNSPSHSSELSKAIHAITLTTETAPNLKITKRIEIVTAECAFGMNIFKDLFAGVRDIVGGRSEAVQKTMRDSRKTVLYELKKEAYEVGANAVIAVDLDYTQLGAGGNMMVLVSASGTAVVIEG